MSASAETVGSITLLLSKHSNACFHFNTEMKAASIIDTSKFNVVYVDHPVIRKKLRAINVMSVPAVVDGGYIYQGEHAFTWLNQFETKLRKLISAAPASSPAPAPAPVSANADQVAATEPEEIVADTQESKGDILSRARAMEKQREALMNTGSTDGKGALVKRISGPN